MGLIVADDAEFLLQLNGQSKVIVKYFADWCGSCKLFAPKFKRLSSDERFKDLIFLDVNAEKNPEARKAGQVKNLPTFAIFKDGQLIDSISTNKEEVIIQLMEKLA